MGRALSGGTLQNGTVARCGMSCGHVLTSEQKTNMREGKRHGERGEPFPVLCCIYGYTRFTIFSPYRARIMKPWKAKKPKRKAEKKWDTTLTTSPPTAT